MKFTIENLSTWASFDENGKTSKGYAFMDEFKGCIIIVYGEGRRDLMAKYLEGNIDPLHLKYHIIDLK